MSRPGSSNGSARVLMRQNFVEYASYFVSTARSPTSATVSSPCSGASSTRSSTWTTAASTRSPTSIGETMKLHPHGDASIGDALVVLANKGYFIERQGNFGNVLTGHPRPPRATSSAA